MKLAEAKRLLDGSRAWHDEGYLDIAARLEAARGLTPDEQVALNAIWRNFRMRIRKLAQPVKYPLTTEQMSDYDSLAGWRRRHNAPDSRRV